MNEIKFDLTFYLNFNFNFKKHIPPACAMNQLKLETWNFVTACETRQILRQ